MEINEAGLDALIEALSEMNRYKPVDDTGHITKGFKLDPEGDISVFATDNVKSLLIEVDIGDEGLDFNWGLMLSEVIYSMPLKAIKIHNSPKDYLHESLEMLPSPEAAKDATVVLHLKECKIGGEDDAEDDFPDFETVTSRIEQEGEEACEAVQEDEREAIAETFRKKLEEATKNYFSDRHKNFVGKVHTKFPVVKKVMDALKANKSIEVLYIRVWGEDANLEEDMIATALPMLLSYWAFHPTITSLDLSNCNLGGTGSIVVAMIISKNTTLTRLDITETYKPRMGLERGVFEGEDLKKLVEKANIRATLEEWAMGGMYDSIAPPTQQ